MYRRVSKEIYESETGMMCDSTEKWWRATTGEANRTAEAGDVREVEWWGQGSEDNMRRKRRLESFQPLFPALVIRVWCHHCLIKLFIHSSDQGEGYNGTHTKRTTFHSHLYISLLSLWLTFFYVLIPCNVFLPHVAGSNPTNLGCLKALHSPSMLYLCPPHNTPLFPGVAQIAKIKLLSSYCAGGCYVSMIRLSGSYSSRVYV